ncbi:MAG: HD-GYP domain-containing protein [Dehalococcoidia bacterium]
MAVLLQISHTPDDTEARAIRSHGPSRLYLAYLVAWAILLMPAVIAGPILTTALVIALALITELIAPRHSGGVVTASGFLVPFVTIALGVEAGLAIVMTSTLFGDGVVRRQPRSLVLWHAALLTLMAAGGAVAADSIEAVAFLTPVARTIPFIWIAIFAGWSTRRICAGNAAIACLFGPAIIGIIVVAVTSPRWLPYAGNDLRPWVESGGRGMAFAGAFMLVDFFSASLRARMTRGPVALHFWLEHLPYLFFRYAGLAVIGGLAAYWYEVDGIMAVLVCSVVLLMAQTTYSFYQRLEEITESLMGAFGEAIDARDPYTAGHSLRVAEYAVQFGVYLGWSPGRVEKLRKAALLHDIGKIGVSDSVLFKPGRLEPHEFEEMKRHASIGESVVMHIAGLQEVATIVGQDHERWAGGGYPRGIKGTEILPEGRLVAIVDVFDAMTTTRPYRDALTEDQALAHIESVSGDQLEPEMTRVFVDMVRARRESGVVFCYCATH